MKNRIREVRVTEKLTDPAEPELWVSVVPERQRQGLGGKLLEHLMNIARGHGATRLFLEVRPSNAAGLALYQRHGFIGIGRRKGYYPAAAGREDAIVMAKDL